MAPVDPQILSPRDTLKDGKIRLDGPLMTDATKFGVQCLNLPQSASVIKYLAGIDDPTYNQYADILSKLAKTFVEMFRIGEHFSARLYGLNAACDDIVKFADFAEANFPTLFQYFRDVRDNPSHEAHAKLETLNKQTLIATHNAASLASIVGFEDCVRDWSEQQSKLNEIYDELETRMKDPKIKEIIDRVLKYQGSTPGKGLVNLKDWMRDIDDKTSKAAHDLKLFRGSWTALQGDAADLEQFATEPHSERTNAFMRVELASLLEGWTRVRDEVQKLQKDHLHAALEAIDRAPSMY